MNADLSVAPEIAQLAAPLVLMPAPQRASLTDGQLATALSQLAAAPQRWWDLVRFDPDGAARIPVPAPFGAWLLVIPPGQSVTSGCQLATLVAGEATEEAAGAPEPEATPGSASQARAAGGKRLRPGRVLVHAPGVRHLIRAAGHGYAVTLHGVSSGG